MMYRRRKGKEEVVKHINTSPDEEMAGYFSSGVGRIAILNIAMILLYLLAGGLSFSIYHQNGVVTLSAFLPEGFALAGVLIYGPRIIPGIFLGQLLLALNSGLGWFPAGGIALVNSLEALIAYRLSRRYALDLNLSSIRDLMLLTGMILLILQPFSAILGNGVLYLAGMEPLSSFKNSLFFWWFGNVLGQLLITPFLLLLHTGYRRINYLRLGVYIFGMAALNYLMQITLHIHSLPVLMMITIPLLIHCIHKDMLYGLGAAVGLALSTLWFTHNGQGLFAYSSQDLTQSLLNLNFFILSNLFLALFVGIIFREKDQALAHLHAVAHQDQLTGLPNRHYLPQLLNHQRRADDHTLSMLCYLDLDGFKKINDQYGHAVGDLVLKEIAARIRAFLRNGDELLRLGGDEFLIVLRKIKHPDEAEKIMSRLIQEIEAPIYLRKETLQLSASIGMIPLPKNITDPDALISRADTAMYRAKKNGKGHVVFLQQ